MIDRNCYWCDAIFSCKCCVTGYAGHHVSKQDVEYRTNRKRTKNTPWHIALWIFCFLCCRTHSIESYVSKEDNCRSPDDATEAKVSKSAGIVWDVWIVISSINVFPAKENKY